MGEDPEDPKDWDTKGLASWAMSRYQVQVSQNQLRKMDPLSVELMLKETALEQIAKRDTSGLLKYLEPDYALRRFANGRRTSSTSKPSPRNCLPMPTGTSPSRRRRSSRFSRIARKEAYVPREIEYPIDHAMTFAFGDANTTEINPYGVDYIRAWAKAKYGEDISAEQVRDTIASPPARSVDRLPGKVAARREP